MHSQLCQQQSVALSKNSWLLGYIDQNNTKHRRSFLPSICIWRHSVGREVPSAANKLLEKPKIIYYKVDIIFGIFSTDHSLKDHRIANFMAPTAPRPTVGNGAGRVRMSAGIEAADLTASLSAPQPIHYSSRMQPCVAAGWMDGWMEVGQHGDLWK